MSSSSPLRHRDQAGVTVVEALVALALLGVASMLLMQGTIFLRGLEKLHAERMNISAIEQQVKLQGLALAQKVAMSTEPCKDLADIVERNSLKRKPPMHPYSMALIRVSEAKEWPSWLKPLTREYDGVFDRCVRNTTAALRGDKNIKAFALCFEVVPINADGDAASYLSDKVVVAEMLVGFRDLVANRPVSCQEHRDLPAQDRGVAQYYTLHIFDPREPTAEMRHRVRNGMLLARPLARPPSASAITFTKIYSPPGGK